MPVNDFLARMVDSKLSMLEIQSFIVSRKGARTLSTQRKLKHIMTKCLQYFFDTKTRMRKVTKFFSIAKMLIDGKYFQP